MSYSTDTIRQLPAPTVKRLLRERGYTLSRVAREMKRTHALVSRVVSKQSTSERVWDRIARIVNGPPKAA